MGSRFTRWTTELLAVTAIAGGTAWVRTVKLPEYATRAYLTAAGIASYDTGFHRWNREQRSEPTTRSNVESPAVATGTRSGRLRVQGGFVGPYQFDSAHTYRF